ncbi:Aldo/keto reductase [Myriangium duriaei CBS 260.36]|uniref:Aldo/keto reductase n=1 Tax=Myriangium duriaei CBS 260.36 TaxID=1168546 RepID=A0A9P4IXD3_9PEZI|nr:Aldo/keto reductase [Myriangium duriaei CBS 260.36]
MAAPLNKRLLHNNSPVPLPALAYGTFEAKEGERTTGSENATLAALKAGYRHIDTASYYYTEEAVGKAIKRSGVPREDIVLTTKFWNHHHEPADVARSLDESLKRLGLDYVDLYLMHWPIAFKRTESDEVMRDSNGKPVIDEALTKNHEPTWRAMEQLVDSGKARSIGVSNFSIPQLEKLLSFARIKPACNQVELHPLLPQNKLLEFCNKQKISLTAYSPLGSQGVEQSKSLKADKAIVEAAEKLNIEPAQLLIAWGIQRGTGVIPKSATPSRIESNFNVPTLPDDVFETINNIVAKDPSRRTRYVNMSNSWGIECFPEVE